MNQLLTAAISGQIINMDVNFTESQNIKLQDLIAKATLESEGRSMENMHMRMARADTRRRTPIFPDTHMGVEETTEISVLGT